MPGTDNEFDAENIEELYIGEHGAAGDASDDENLRITDESIAIVAGVAATEVESVARMSVGIAGGIAEALGRHNPAKGVKVEMIEDEAVIDLYVIVNYGSRISDIAWEIQEHVKDSVEKLTGVVVSAVNIHIQGIEFGDETKRAVTTEKAIENPAPKKNKTRDMSVFQFFDDIDD
ncbi:MAG: Asp23/Gls24 family envelope stress response protein [Ruminococcaceae bacterium]|nr:Asp23/Gls24 family envelope stress response protein [Oscillospiraceae bacterium]